jgi:hypothetical protein
VFEAVAVIAGFNDMAVMGYLSQYSAGWAKLRVPSGILPVGR